MPIGSSKKFGQIFNLRFLVTLLAGVLLIVISHYVLAPPTAEQGASLVKIIFHEAGFALLVALVIWAMFEFFSQAEADDQWNERIEKIAKSVFLEFSVVIFRKSLSKRQMCSYWSKRLLGPVCM